ncbi:MAG: long-chain fatty acid--CoA ligase [Acidobacteriota bacterium]|nr:long-chain fatty acid--CoA ligase [Blastocatellia bacterium]MDW8413669.1 long-chain fatty acid--CoA ligase [Acidobacteriota bacterium]
MKYANIYKLFCDRTSANRSKPIFYIRREGIWQPILWEKFEQDVYYFAQALVSTGLKPGTSVCILMSNVPEWPIADVGTIIAGGIGVGLYPTSSPEQCRFIIEHSDAEYVVVDTRTQLEKILQVRNSLPKLRYLLVLDESCSSSEVIPFKTFLKMGEAANEARREVINRACAATAEDTAIMVYTSGTTGLPKGACLSHRYVINSCESLLETIPISPEDTSFSYLPYCHVAERISGLYNRLYAGAPAYFVDDINKLWQYMQEVRPTVFGSLPRFYEKIHARILADVEKSSQEDKELFYKVLDLGRHISHARQAKQKVPEEVQAEYDALARPVIEKVRGYFGGRIRIATSGGAPLPLEIAEFFDALGLPILQAYGLTENVCVAFNRPDNYRFGTVGPAMPGCQIRIAEDSEILVRSEMMFSGYYKEPEKTAEMFRDGWLLTGDLGELTEDGFLKITGRKKELIVTSTGKNVAPALLENLLKEHHLISQAMAYGDGKSYITALITLNQAETEEYARSRGIEYGSFAELTKHPQIVSLVEQIVNAVNARVSSTEAIKKFVILDHDLSLEADEITPTLKIKRNVVAKNYGHLLEALYS